MQHDATLEEDSVSFVMGHKLDDLPPVVRAVWATYTSFWSERQLRQSMQIAGALASETVSVKKPKLEKIKLEPGSLKTASASLLATTSSEVVLSLLASIPLRVCVDDLRCLLIVSHRALHSLIDAPIAHRWRSAPG